MFLNEFKMDSSYNLSNDVELDSIYEEVLNYYINDYTIFEAALRRDFLEVNGILTEDGNKNFIQKIWAGLKKLFKIIIDKLKQLLHRFLDIISSIKANAFIKKYKKYYEKENGELIDFKYEKGFYKYKHSGSLRLKGFVPLDKFVDINNIKYTTEATKSELKDLKLYIHNELVDDNKSIYPFKEHLELKNEISDDIFQLSGTREIEDDIKKTIKDCEKTQKEIDNKIKNIKEDNSEELEKYKAYLEYLNVMKVYLINSISIYCTEYANIYKDYCALYKAGGEYLKSKMKGKGNNNTTSSTDKEESTEESFIIDDIDYINAVTEAEIYELEL